MPTAVELKKVYDSPEELTLVHRAKDGDEDAFRSLYNAHRHRVYVTINRMLADADATQVVANVAFTQIWRHLSSFKEQSRFSTWITRIAINEARMHLRSAKKRQCDVSLDSMLADSGSVSPNHRGHRGVDPALAANKWLGTRDLNLEGTIDRQLLEHAMSRVPEQFQRILRLRFWEGLTLDEIRVKISKEELEPITKPAIKSRYLRGKNYLKEELERFS